MGKYAVALICLNGHLITATLLKDPQKATSYCEKCGAATIFECQHCKAGIHGRYKDPYGRYRSYWVPSFCHSCGRPYPWTEKKLEAARELSEELEGLTDEEKEVLNKSIDDMITDNPRTEIGVTKFKKFMLKAKGVAVEPFRKLIVDISSETAVKLLKGP